MALWYPKGDGGTLGWLWWSCGTPMRVVMHGGILE